MSILDTVNSYCSQPVAETSSQIVTTVYVIDFYFIQLKDICIEVIGFNNCIVSEPNLVAFASIIKALVTKIKQSKNDVLLSLI